MLTQMVSTVWFSVMILSSLRSVKAVDWCSLKCKDGTENTMCKYKPVSVSGNCTSIRESTTPTIRRGILEFHNVYRNALASSRIPGWPKAANMRYMTWDGKLEQLAIRWAMQCISHHDKCRRTPEFEYVGQNFGMIGNSVFYLSSNLTFQGWVDEIRLANTSVVTSFQPGKWMHFTQVGWADSYKLGCGEIRYVESYLKKTAIVCNYAPTGNIVSAEMYKVGEPCSKCPYGTSCQKQSVYPNLCSIPAYVIPRSLKETKEELEKTLSEKLSKMGGTPSQTKFESMSIVYMHFIVLLLNS